MLVLLGKPTRLLVGGSVVYAVSPARPDLSRLPGPGPGDAFFLYRRAVQPMLGCMQAPGCLLQSGIPLFSESIDSEKGDQCRSISKSALNTWHLQALHGAGASPMTHPSCQLVTWHHVWCPEAADWSTSTSCCRYIPAPCCDINELNIAHHLKDSASGPTDLDGTDTVTDGTLVWKSRASWEAVCYVAVLCGMILRC